MASTRANGSPQFILTPQQQNLLFRALTSNQSAGNQSSNNVNDPLSLSPETLNGSPQVLNQGLSMPANPQESPYLDYDYDFGPDSSFDFDFINDGQAKMIGDLPGTSPVSKTESKAVSPDNESPDKRSHPEAEDDEEIEEGGGKRRESEGKVAKKPGRKPLMNEPSTKRKAQNRAAQRAFRERKEKHVKDLEVKVEELEKASASTNTENAQLKAQIEKLTVELNTYKKRLSVAVTSTRTVSGGGARNSFGSAALQNLNDVNFQFEFPKFGLLPTGPSSGSQNAKDDRAYPSPSTSSGTHQSPIDLSKDQASPGNTKSRSGSDAMSKQSSKTPGLFNNPLYDTIFTNNNSRTSLDSASFSLNGGNTSSPSASSNSNAGPSSSCGTSPEPCTQSPLGFKPVDTLSTIGEEQPSLTSTNLNSFGNFNNVDLSLDWLSQQNGGQFDPQLFGDYREPQENIPANTTFDDSFFNDAFEMDFTTPYNMAPSPNLPKKNLIAEIDARKESEDTISAVSNGKLLTCSNIWEKLQTCPKVQNGDLDLDGLCSDLQKKAKCGGTGAVVDEHDFKTIMTKYLGPEDAKNCPDALK